MKYEALILDLDGTLINTLPDIVKVVNSVTGRMGMPPCSEEKIRSSVGNGVEALLRNIGVPEQWNRQLSYEVSAGYRHMSHSSAWVYTGVREMLDVLVKSSISVCILSNKPIGGVRRSLADHLPEYSFASIGGASSGLPAKPDPGMLLEMLKELRIHPEKALVIGDGEADVMTASAAGADHVAVLWGYRSRDELSAAGATTFAERPMDIVSLAELQP